MIHLVQGFDQIVVVSSHEGEYKVYLHRKGFRQSINPPLLLEFQAHSRANKRNVYAKEQCKCQYRAGKALMLAHTMLKAVSMQID